MLHNTQSSISVLYYVFQVSRVTPVDSKCQKSAIRRIVQNGIKEKLQAVQHTVNTVVVVSRRTHDTPDRSVRSFCMDVKRSSLRTRNLALVLGEGFNCTL